MRLCYQVATPDVARSFSVTAYQGNLQDSLADLAAFGYDAVELMVRDIRGIDRRALERALQRNGLSVSLLCTGEIFGQGGLNLSDPEMAVREATEEKVRETIDLAASLGANINIGRVRGNYCDAMAPEETRFLAAEALRRLAVYADRKHVWIALEPITMLQSRFLNTVEEAARFADQVGATNVGYMMDLFHMNIEETDLINTIRRFGARCLHVHLADNNRRFAGAGNLDFQQIICSFHDCGYAGDFCAEIWQLPDQASAAQSMISHLQPVFAQAYGRK